MDLQRLLRRRLLALAAVGDRMELVPGEPLERRAGPESFSRRTPRGSSDPRVAASADSQTQQIDVATFTQWVDAYALDEKELAAFYLRRFRAEFKPAVHAGIATRALKNANAPLTPFAMPQYRLAARADAVRLEASAEALLLGQGAHERPALDELRARRRPLRRGAVLRPGRA